jgi:hypothetical protein
MVILADNSYSKINVNGLNVEQQLKGIGEARKLKESTLPGRPSEIKLDGINNNAVFFVFDDSLPVPVTYRDKQNYIQAMVFPPENPGSKKKPTTL